MSRLQTLTTEQAMNRKHIDFTARAKDTTIRKEADGDYDVVEVPIQSINRDRDGDIISEKGQAKILEQLKSGDVPAFPNHGWGESSAMYAFQDIMGQWLDGTIREDQVTMGTLRLRKGSEYAEHLLDLMEQDMPVGFSIGFIVREADENKDGSMVIHDLDLLEVSPVGIPSNASAVAGSGFTRGERVAMAAKGIVDSGGSPGDVAEALEKALAGDDEEEPEPDTDKSPSPMTSDKEQEKTPEPDESEKQDTPKSEETPSKENGEGEDEKQSPEENAEELEVLAAKIEELEARVDSLEDAMSDDEDEESDSADEDEDSEERNAEGLSDDEKSRPDRQPKKIKKADGEGEESEKDPNVVDAPATGFSEKY